MRMMHVRHHHYHDVLWTFRDAIDRDLVLLVSLDVLLACCFCFLMGNALLQIEDANL